MLRSYLNINDRIGRGKLAFRKASVFIFSLLFLFPKLTFGYEAPVSDLSPVSNTDELSKIKRQVAHILEMNHSGKIEMLQQEIQTLRGTIEKQSHDIKTLQSELTATLNKRLVQESHSPSQKASKTTQASETLVQKIDPAPVSNYEKAIEAIRNKQYLQAQNFLIEYLAIHPHDKLAGNAHFWLGEVYYQQNKRTLAKREFEILRKDYPASPKLANALLKLGYLEVDEENFGKAKEIFNRVIKKFPETSSAQLAKIKLDKLTKNNG